MFVVDAHEDIAWNMLMFGRDYTQSAKQLRRRESSTSIPQRTGQVMLGGPDWRQGGVGVIFATLFASPKRAGSPHWPHQCYRNVDEAHFLYDMQIRLYHQLVNRYPDQFYLITNKNDLAVGMTRWHAAPADQKPIGLVILMEGADGIRNPCELPRWFAQGVRIIGPAWRSTRYAGGTGEPGPFSREGRALLAQMAQAGIILDVSHLSDEGVSEALDHYPGRVIASHSNARALLPGCTAQRHLSDDTIRRIAARDGVIGTVLVNPFLRDGVTWTSPREQVTVEDVVRHIDHICQLTGSTRHLGIGSDFDGGCGLEHAPSGLDSVADLPRLGDALAQRGYSQTEVEAILGRNWLRVLLSSLPD